MGNKNSRGSSGDALETKKKNNKNSRYYKEKMKKERDKNKKNIDSNSKRKRRYSLDNEYLDEEKYHRESKNMKHRKGKVSRGRSENDLTEFESERSSTLYPNYEVKRIGIYKTKEDAIEDNVYRTVVWNPKYYRSWDKFMEHLTEVIKPNNGPIERLFTPTHGRMVPKEFAAIENNKNYIVASNIDSKNFAENFKGLSKSSSTTSFSEETSTSPASSMVEKNMTHRQEWSNKPLVINVYRNRDIYYKPMVIRLRKYQLESMERVIDAIGEKVTLMSCTPIRRLYNLDGTMVRDGSELNHAGYYVAAGLEKFEILDYTNNDLIDFRHK